MDRRKCTGCGRCADICPSAVIAIRDGVAVTQEEECMVCGHCYCVCPAGAVSFHPEILRKPFFTSFPYAEQIVGPGKVDAQRLVNIFRSRRSVRNYSDREIPAKMLDDLVEFAVTAPSGSNCQEWRFTVVHGRPRVWDVAQRIGGFFNRLNRLVRNPLVRFLSVPVAGLALVRYYRDHYESVERGLAEAVRGRDLLFHGATSLILVHGEMTGSTPVEDAQYAAYNMTLLAHTLGLGSCFIGYAVESINRSASIKRHLGIPKGHRVHAVLALGYPKTRFLHQALRKPAVITRVD